MYHSIACCVIAHIMRQFKHQFTLYGTKKRLSANKVTAQRRTARLAIIVLDK